MIFSSVAGVVVVGCSLVAAAACQSSSSQPSSHRTVLAMVGTHPIYADDFEREFARVRVETDATLPSALSQDAHRRTLLDDLIDRYLLLAEAEKSNVFVGSDEVEMAYDKARAGWSPEEFEAALLERDTTPSEFKDELRESLTILAYFRDHVFSRLAVTDDEIAAYLEAHPEFMMIPEQVRARQIVVNTEEQANEIAREIQQGLAFEDAAMKYSLSPDAAVGGDLGLFSCGDMPEAFDGACFALHEHGVSKTVASPYGFHLFQLVERRLAQQLDLAVATDRVEALLRADKEREAHTKKVQQLRAATRVEVSEGG